MRGHWTLIDGATFSTPSTISARGVGIRILVEIAIVVVMVPIVVYR